MMKILRAPIRAGSSVLNVYIHAWRILTRRRPKPAVAPEATLLDPAEFQRRFEGEMGGQGALGVVDFKGSCAPGAPLRRAHWQSAGIKSADE
jgi:hypothetical protein